MTLGAAAFPILPGKTDDWRKFIGELNGARRQEYEASRKALGIHERTFLQPTPMGDMVIVTLEGEDPGGAFARLAASTDPFSTWFLAKVKEIHGFDLADVASGPMPALVVDSAS
jgi:LmbE family N-acetylglucosaminyl deacetylase